MKRRWPASASWHWRNGPRRSRRQWPRRCEQAALDVALRLVDAVRRLDEQATLSGVLDALADLTAAEAGRAAVFVVADEGLQVWRVVGLDAPAG